MNICKSWALRFIGLFLGVVFLGFEASAKFIGGKSAVICSTGFNSGSDIRQPETPEELGTSDRAEGDRGFIEYSSPGEATGSMGASEDGSSDRGGNPSEF